MNLDTAQMWECGRCGTQRKYGTTERYDGGEVLLTCARCIVIPFTLHKYVDTVAEVPAYSRLALTAGVH